MRDILRSVLLSAARSGRTLTYAELARQLALQPPHTIHRTGLLLEDLMRDQAAKPEPQLASFVVSRARAGLPAPGFFMMMREMSLYDVRTQELRRENWWRMSARYAQLL